MFGSKFFFEGGQTHTFSRRLSLLNERKRERDIPLRTTLLENINKLEILSVITLSLSTRDNRLTLSRHRVLLIFRKFC